MSIFLNGNGKINERQQDHPSEEGTIGDELVEGPLSVHEQRV